MKIFSLISILLFITMLHLSPCLYAQNSHIETSVPKWVGRKAIHFFQKYISPIDGKTCNFYPTCSEYAKECIDKWGLLRGTIMASDRLQRCNSCVSTKDYPYFKKGRLWDSPEENNFW